MGASGSKLVYVTNRGLSGGHDGWKNASNWEPIRPPRGDEKRNGAPANPGRS